MSWGGGDLKRRMRWAGRVARMGKRRGAYRVLMEKAVGKRPRCGWENNIKMYFQELEWRFVDWIVQASERGSWRAVVNTVMNLRSA